MHRSTTGRGSDVEADPADLADQQLLVDPDLEPDEPENEDGFPLEAEPADVVEQRRVAPIEE